MHYKFLATLGICSICSLLTIPMYAQISNKVAVADSDQHIYEVADEMPTFKGNLSSYFMDNVHYPDSATDPTGKIFIRFIVNQDGSLENISILRSSGIKALDQEVIRVMKLMPKWNPGKNHDVPVRVYFTAPIIIDIDK